MLEMKRGGSVIGGWTGVREKVDSSGGVEDVSD